MNVRNRWLIGHFFTHIVIIFFALLMLYPIVWLFIKSFTPNDEIFSNITALLPDHFTFENYAAGFMPKGTLGKSFIYYMGNSIYMSLIVVIFNGISCSMAAYAFARIKFALRGFWFAIVLITLTLPIMLLRFHATSCLTTCV